MLEWGVSAQRKEGYNLSLRKLSPAEERVVEEVSDRFKETSKRRELGGQENEKRYISELVAEYCRENSLSIDSEQRDYLAKYSFLNILGLCGIDLLLEDDGVEEMGVIGINKPVYVYIAGSGWKETNLIFRSESIVTDVINKIARSLGRRITFQNPTLNAVLPDGSRLHASIPPISHVEMTIRKFRSRPISIPDLLNYKTYSLEALAFLSLVFQSDYSVIVAGNTASGKTSTLNALFSYIPLNERILIIEETPEINIPHKHVIKMLSNVGLQINMRSLVEDTLRMRPDRVIVGEVRTPEEVSALIETILSGQARGSYATFHAQSSDEAVKRIVSLGVLPIDVASLDFIVVQRRMLRYDTKTRRSWEERRGVEIAEVLQEDSRPKINPIFSLNTKTGGMSGSPIRASRIDEIADNFSITRKELMEEIDRRKRMIEKISRKSEEFANSVFEIQNSLFKLGGEISESQADKASERDAENTFAIS